MKTWSRVFGALAISALVTTMSMVTGEAQATGLFHEIKNVGSNKCLQAVGRPIVQVTCNGSLAQAWQFQPKSGGKYWVVNQLTGACMRMDGPVVSGSPVGLDSCDDGASNYLWQPVPGPVSVGILKTRAGGATNLCLDVPGGASTEGLAVQVFTCNGTPAQGWVMGF